MPGCVCTIFFTVGPGEQLRVIHGVKAAVAAAAEGAVWLEGILEGCVGGVGMVVPVHAALLQVLLLCGIQLIAVHGADCTAAMLLLLSHWSSCLAMFPPLPSLASLIRDIRPDGCCVFPRAAQHRCSEAGAPP
eukprot:1160353-Pelagomonas_calceolata.AAC.3